VFHCMHEIVVHKAVHASAHVTQHFGQHTKYHGLDHGPFKKHLAVPVQGGP